jgi:hypothetical protein
MSVGNAGAAVELPFEWFHGRWVEGHRFYAGFIWQDHYGVDFSGDYLFQTGRHEIGLARVSEAPLWKNDEGVLEPPVPFWRYRPNDRWQVAIDGIIYDEESTSFVPSGFTGVVSEESKDLQVNVSSVWQSQPTMTLDTAEAAYNYAVGRLFARSFTVAAIQASLANSSFGAYRLDPVSYGPTNQLAYDYSDWRIRSTLGMREFEWLQSSFAFSLAGRSSTEATCTIVKSSVQDWDHYETQNLVDMTKLTAVYEIGALVTAIAPVYLVTYWRQQVEQLDSISSRIVYSDTAQPAYSYDYRNGDLGESGRSVSFRLHWVTAGDFIPSLLRDDYGTGRQLSVFTTTGCSSYRSGFYRGLFPAGMQLMSLDYTHDSYTPQGYEEADTEELSLRWRRGFGGRFEVSFATRRYRSIASRFERAAGTAATYWTSELGARWRSYEYDPDTGPSWNRDSDMDIAFGSRLAAGQWYGTISFVLPTLRQTGLDISVFDFSDLENDHQAELHLTATVGLGRTIEAALALSEFYVSSSIAGRAVHLALSARVFSRCGLEIAYTEFSRYSSGRGLTVPWSVDRWSNEAVVLQLHALL